MRIAMLALAVLLGACAHTPDKVRLHAAGSDGGMIRLSWTLDSNPATPPDLSPNGLIFDDWHSLEDYRHINAKRNVRRSLREKIKALFSALVP